MQLCLSFFRECADNHITSHTNPGGYLEIEDILSPLQCRDDTLKGTALEKWGEFFLESSIKLGVPLDSALTVKKNMEEAGYVDVVQVIYEWPMNKWPADKKMKEIGTYCFLVYIITWSILLVNFDLIHGYRLLGEPSTHRERCSI